jgi:RimJ/RimL family protein N-acetyltransferase
MDLHPSRLLLRDLVLADWPTGLAYQQDPHYLRYYAWTERAPEAVQEFVGRFVPQNQAQPRRKYQFAITLLSTGLLTGNCGVRKESADALEASLGYELVPDQWGQGYATEAARAVLDFGFTHLKIHRITADCVGDNNASAKVLIKLGFQLEGRLREKEFYKGRWWDSLLFAILEPEWRTRATPASEVIR